MYADDTFFQLSLTGRIGLLLISGGLGALTLWACHVLTRRVRWPLRLLGALGVFVVFEWLAPQIHYLWYRAVIDGLPLQWVIGPWPDTGAAWRVLFLQEAPGLSAHARALLGWACVAVALVGRTRTPPQMSGVH